METFVYVARADRPIQILVIAINSIILAVSIIFSSGGRVLAFLILILTVIRIAIRIIRKEHIQLRVRE